MAGSVPVNANDRRAKGRHRCRPKPCPLSLSHSYSHHSHYRTPTPRASYRVPSTRGGKTGWKKKRWILGGRGRSGRAAIWQEAALPCCRYRAVGCFSAVGFNSTHTRTAPAGGATRVAAEFWLAGGQDVSGTHPLLGQSMLAQRRKTIVSGKITTRGKGQGNRDTMPQHISSASQPSASQPAHRSTQSGAGTFP